MNRITIVRVIAAVLIGCSLIGLARLAVPWIANRPIYTTMLAGGGCKHPLVKAILRPPVMSESESRELAVLVNPFGRRDLRPPGQVLQALPAGCNIDLEISAPAFDHDPEGSVRRIHLDSVDEDRSVTWVLAPKRKGEQLILIKSGLDETRIPVSVISDIGLTAAQTACAYAASGLVGFVLMLLTLREGIASSLGVNSSSKAVVGKRPRRNRKSA